MARTAVNPSSDEKPTASQFTTEDKTLEPILHAAGTEGTEATVQLTIKGKPFTVKFAKHEH